MPYPNGSTGGGRRPTPTRLPGYGRVQTAESEYPDPSLLHNPSISSSYTQQRFHNESTSSCYTQTGPYDGSTSSSHMQQGFYNESASSSYKQPGPYDGSTSSGYPQQGTEAFDDEVLPWPVHSRALNQWFADLDPNPNPDPKWMSEISEDLFDVPLSAESMQQSLGNQYSTSSFAQTNIPTTNINNLASEGLYNPNGRAVEHYGPGVQQSAPRGRNQRATQSQTSEQKKRRSLRLRPSRSRPSRAANTAAAESGGQLSKLGQRRAALGGNWGSDRRDKAPIQRIDGVLYGWVDGQLERAGYHCDFREKLIHMDAEQLGAPVFREGSSPNYTSYSPVTREWTADPASVTDSKGRQVHFLPTRPVDLHYNPADGYLKCDGLVLLDQNNRAIKAFPGAPRTLSTETPGWLLESLRRVFDMSYPDLKPTGPNVGRVPAKRRSDQAAFWDNELVEPDAQLQAEAQRVARGSLVRPGKGQDEGELTL